MIRARLRLGQVSQSLWARVILVMVVPALVGLFLAYLVFSHIAQAQERASTVASKTEKAQVVASVIEHSPTQVNLQAMQRLMGDDQLIIELGGRRLFTGPPNPELPALQIRVPMTNGSVRLVSDVDSTSLLSAKLTAVAVVLTLFLLASAGLGTGVLLRSVRGPLRRAIGAADRLSAGDLAARIGPAGTTEFHRLASTFDAMAQRLEDTDRRQREFLADLAHEIATPLNTLTGISVGILEGTIRTPRAREQAVELLETEMDRVRSLLADIRRVGLAELDTLSGIRDEPVDLAAVCQRARARFHTRATTSNVQLRLHARAIHVRSDQRLIETILDNLLSNAIRYTPWGGRITLSVRRRGEDAIIAVTDTGPGIPADHHARIFERFYRTDTARDRDHGGSGLGLAIAQRTALALRGRIELDSTEGHGSEFRLVLPADTNRPARTATEAMPTAT